MCRDPVHNPKREPAHACASVRTSALQLTQYGTVQAASRGRGRSPEKEGVSQEKQKLMSVPGSHPVTSFSKICKVEQRVALTYVATWLSLSLHSTDREVNWGVVHHTFAHGFPSFSQREKKVNIRLCPYLALPLSLHSPYPPEQKKGMEKNK